MVALNNRAKKKLDRKLKTLDDICAELDFKNKVFRVTGYVSWLAAILFALLDPIRALLLHTNFGSKHFIGMGYQQGMAIGACISLGIVFLILGKKR